MKLLRPILAAVLAAFLGTVASVASAQGYDLPTPIFFKADPQMVYPNTPGWLDSNGRIAIYISGENLSPDSDLGHPAGPDGGYQHIFLRGVSPHGDKATAWVPATADNGCQVYGGAAQSVIILGIDPHIFLSEPGSHLQVKLWVSAGATMASEPAQAGTRCSGWSAIKTIDVALAGATKPTPVSTKEIPTISRLAPTNYIVTDRSANYRIRIYGQYLCGSKNVVIFNGDVAGAVPAEDHCKGVDEDGSFLKGGEAVFHVTIPEKYRRSSPGQITVMVNNGEGNSNVRPITFNALAIKPAGNAKVPLPMSTLQTPITVLTRPSQTLGQGPKVGPSISRLSAATLVLGDRNTNYRIRIYGQNLCATDNKVVFNGDLGGALAAEDACKSVDDDGSPLKGGEALFHITIPERFRRAGQITVAVKNGQGQSDPVVITFKPALEVQPKPMITAPKPVLPPAPIKAGKG